MNTVCKKKKSVFQNYGFYYFVYVCKLAEGRKILSDKKIGTLSLDFNNSHWGN